MCGSIWCYTGSIDKAEEVFRPIRGITPRRWIWLAFRDSRWMLGVGSPAVAEPASAPRDFSGWRGGIGITFGTPSRDIADVTEMGYEIVWGGEDPRAVKALGIAVFRYWNSIVETSQQGAGYDFSRMPDKDQAAKLLLRGWRQVLLGTAPKGQNRPAQGNALGPGARIVN